MRTWLITVLVAALVSFVAACPEGGGEGQDGEGGEGEEGEGEEGEEGEGEEGEGEGEEGEGEGEEGEGEDGVVFSNGVVLGGRTVDLEVGDLDFDTDSDCSFGLLGDCATVAAFDRPDVCVCSARNISIAGAVTVTGTAALVLAADDRLVIRGAIIIAGTSEAGGAGAVDVGFTDLVNDDIVPLVGGITSAGAGAGGAGGALQLVAGSEVRVTGLVSAGGGGGRALGGAGGDGGDGGAVLIEAPSVAIIGVVAANGGGGAGGSDDDGNLGSNGSPGDESGGGGGPGNDGHGCALDETSGGDGGNGGDVDGPAISGGSGDVASCLTDIRLFNGGSGGSVGRIKIRFAASIDASGRISPVPRLGEL